VKRFERSERRRCGENVGDGGVRHGRRDMEVVWEMEEAI
jgi:hypothetical protein